MAKTKPCRPEVTGPLAEYADGFRAELFRSATPRSPPPASCGWRLT